MIDLNILGCGKTLVAARGPLERLQSVLDKYHPNIVVTSLHRCFNSESEMAVMFDLKYRDLVIGRTEYAWIRVPLIEEQEISGYVLHHPDQAPFVVVGPTGPPERLLGRGVLWCKVTGLFDGYAQELLWRQCLSE
jgi:hypothetical protein